jgi:Pyridoxamine 5'-phosphate oxidase
MVSSSRSAPRPERPTSMTEYGVPLDLDGVLPWSWASERLASNRNYWVITVHPMQRPHAMPVWGVWLESSQRFWFSCAKTAAKHTNLLRNPAVTIANTDTVEVVTIEGVAEWVTEGDELRAAVDAWGAKYGEAHNRKELEEFMAANATWCVRPRRAYAIIEREAEFGPKATRWVWEP